jgi:hypothetical protein
MSALAQMLSAALSQGAPPRVAQAPMSMHGPQGMGPSPMPQGAPHLAPPIQQGPPPMQGRPALPGVAPKLPGPPPRGGPDGKPVAMRPGKHADIESPAENKKEKPGDEEEEDGGMMGAAKKALKKGKDKKDKK